MTNERTCANSLTLSRRTVMTGGAATLLAAPLVAAVPAPSPVVDLMPENLDPDIFANGLLGAAGFVHYMLWKNRPDGSAIKGFQFRCVSGEIVAESIWATVITSDYRLLHARPAVYNGWK